MKSRQIAPETVVDSTWTVPVAVSSAGSSSKESVSTLALLATSCGLAPTDVTRTGTVTTWLSPATMSGSTQTRLRPPGGASQLPPLVCTVSLITISAGSMSRSTTFSASPIPAAVRFSTVMIQSNSSPRSTTAREGALVTARFERSKTDVASLTALFAVIAS